MLTSPIADSKRTGLRWTLFSRHRCKAAVRVKPRSVRGPMVRPVMTERVAATQPTTTQQMEDFQTLQTTREKEFPPALTMSYKPQPLPSRLPALLPSPSPSRRTALTRTPRRLGLPLPGMGRQVVKQRGPNQTRSTREGPHRASKRISSLPDMGLHRAPTTPALTMQWRDAASLRTRVRVGHRPPWTGGVTY